MPSLTNLHLPYAFNYRNNVTMRGGSECIPLSRIDIGALGSHPNLPRHIPNATVCDLEDLLSLNSSVSEIIFNSGIINDPSFTVLDLSRFENVTSIVIGDESFMYVNETSIVGLGELESVEIGWNSFTKEKRSYGNDPNRRLYVKDCPKLKSLKMGRWSFSDYTVIEIENVDALEVIEIGDLNNWNYNFYNASLELKSILIHSE